MSYLDKQTSTEDARPVEIIEVTAGGVGTFRYTSAEDDIVIGANTYSSVPGLRSGKIADGASSKDLEYVIELPTTNALAQIFRNPVLPGVRFFIEVSRFHRNDLPTPEVITVFSGYIAGRSFAREFKTTSLTCRRELARAGKQMPWRTYSYQCPFVLYDPETCTADDSSSAVRASALSVASQSGNVLTVSGGLAGVYPDGWFTAGYVEAIGQSDFRTVLAHEANQLTIMLPFSVPASTVNVIAGCDHLIAGDCANKHDRVEFYGGFFNVPKRRVWQFGIGV